MATPSQVITEQLLPASGQTTRKSGRAWWKLVLALAATGLVVWEVATSFTQAHLFTAAARKAQYVVRAGAATGEAQLAPQGPYDLRLGYARLGEFRKRLGERGYEIERQARWSDGLKQISGFGLFLPFEEKTRAGLLIRGRDGAPLREEMWPQRVYREFHEVPDVIWQSLLYIENRELLSDVSPFRNPAVEWDRLGSAVVGAGKKLVDPAQPTAGGSTLATQLEKVRHSPGGRTGSANEKVRQMLSASLRAYQDGPRTRGSRERIVKDYVNSLPLGSAKGYGEVIGLGDALWAWYGTDFGYANGLLRRLREREVDADTLREAASVYRQSLGMLLAVNRPGYYLQNPAALDERVENYLRLLAREGIIPVRVRDAALAAKPRMLEAAPKVKMAGFASRKAIDATRGALIELLGIENVYALDRLDLTVDSPLDARTTQAVADELAAFKLEGVPSSLLLNFSLYERTSGMNVLRVQSDNLDRPLNLNEGTKLELGSTAKLRTLATYLLVLERLHWRLRDKDLETWRRMAVGENDTLTRWVAQYLVEHPKGELAPMLELAMNREFSANPGEGFFTGGGLHTFANFQRADNERVMPIREAFQRSVNLPFVRLMREIVEHYQAQRLGVKPELLADDDDPARRPYLKRFADYEGKEFLAKFWKRYQPMKAEDRFRALWPAGVEPSAKRVAAAERYVYPERAAASAETAEQERWDLQERAYVAHVHPLELWLVKYLKEHPGAKWSEAIEASTEARQEAYGWLFRSGSKRGRDTRIRVLLEQDTFKEIHKDWKRMGFPFATLVPSYATALGSSGDTPAALAELVGIILNDGVRQPTARVTRLHFAEGTPYETELVRRPTQGEQVFAPEVAQLLHREMIGVVERGTAIGAKGALGSLVIGGKTGTGDNRIERYAANGTVLDSKATNRTATFVFTIGDRYYGTVVAAVLGAEAEGQRFTSALPVTVFKQLAPQIRAVVERTPAAR